MITILLYILLGIFAGAMAGLLGIGGGIVVVPGLSYIFLSVAEIPEAANMHMAAATSLAIMIMTTQVSVWEHNRKGRVLWPVYYDLAPGIVLGALSGVALADNLNTSVLNLSFGILLVLVALRTFLQLQTHAKRGLPGKKGMTVVGYLIGTISSMLGIGGGTLAIPFFRRCHLSMRDIPGVTAMCSYTVAIVGGFMSVITGLDEPNMPAWSIGYIYAPAVLSVAIPSMISAAIAARHAHRFSSRQLSNLFAVLLFFTGLHMLWRW